MKRRIIITLLSLSAVFVHPTHASSNDPERTVGLTYQDADSSEYLMKVLNVLNITYKESKLPEGLRIEWQSNSESQEQEIQNRVSQYHFLKEVCKSKKLPLPSQPSIEKLSCM